MATVSTPTGLEPIGQCDEVDREAGKLAHRFVVSVWWDDHKVSRAADVGGPGPRPVASLPGGLGPGLPRRPATNVTQDHAQTRAGRTIA